MQPSFAFNDGKAANSAIFAAQIFLNGFKSRDCRTSERWQINFI
jgi:hypothetical protein